MLATLDGTFFECLKVNVGEQLQQIAELRNNLIFEL